MASCGNCRLDTVSHVLIANHGICNTCADMQNKAQQSIIQKQYEEYQRLVTSRREQFAEKST